MQRSCLIWRRASSHIRRSSGTLLLRPLSSSTVPPNGAASFPNWLHLKAFAPHKQRMETTDRIANSISKSGGYLTHSTLLSDMATTLVLEDVDPHYLETFIQAIQEIDGVVLEKHSTDELQTCFDMIHQADQEIREKAQHITDFQQSLHDLERDGLIDNVAHQELLQKCHELAHELARKNVKSTKKHTPLPPTVRATLQLTWKDAPGKIKHQIPPVHG